MGQMTRRDYSRGWVPSADAMHAPVNGALRFDNLILDELGAPSLRRGSAKINGSPFADTDIHSLHTAVISGTRYRMAGAGADVYQNGSSLSQTFAGSGDIAMMDWLDQIFMARSTTKKKTDGSTIRTWGIPKPIGKPSVVAVSADSKDLATGDAGETTWAATEGTTGGAGFVADHTGAATSAIDSVAGTTGRGTIVRTLAADTDYSIYTSVSIGASGVTAADPADIHIVGHPFATGDTVKITGSDAVPDINGSHDVTYVDANHVTIDVNVTGAGTATGSVAYLATDDDLFQMWMYVEKPEEFVYMDVSIDVNNASGSTGVTAFVKDVFRFRLNGKSVVNLATGEAGITDPKAAPHATPSGYRRGNAEAVGRAQRRDSSENVSAIRDETGWTKIQIRRRQFTREGGTTNGKGWETVRAIRLTAQMGSAGNKVYYDDLSLRGGSGRTLTDVHQWYYALVKNFTTYQAVSPLSDPSDETLMDSNGATVTAPADTARDGQVDEIWLYRISPKDAIGEPLRVAVKKGVSGTGAVAISDTQSSASALIANIKAKINAIVPPDGVIDMAGPWFDRLYVLTQDAVYVSDVHAPDTFDSDHVINVGDAGETCYWIERGSNGLYVGTSRDVYLITGDGTDLPDGTLNLLLRPMNVGHAPHALRAVANDEGRIIYLASDGWRSLSGGGASARLTGGSVDLLYEGQTRHGVSPVNLGTAASRYRVAVSKGLVSAITPEGSDTTSSVTLHRKDLTLDRWYRHVYGVSWRAIHREPDGTLIASDTAGTVWTLDTGTDDGGANIAVTFWTSVDDDGRAFQRKDPQAYRARADTGNVSATIALHVDGSGSAAKSITATLNGVALTEQTISDMSAYRQIQQRITVTTGAFRWLESNIEHLDRPVLMRAQAQPKGSGKDRLYTGVTYRICTLGVQATITPIVDGSNQTAFTHTSGADNPDTFTHPFAATVTGNEVTFSSDVDLEVYDWTPEASAELPQLLKAWENKPLVTSPVRRRFGGLNVQIDTASAAIDVIPILDGVAQTTITATTADLLGKTLTFNSVVGRDLWARIVDTSTFRVHGVAPVVLATFPSLFKGQTPEQNMGTHARKAFSGITLKACTQGVAATITPILDDTSQTTFSATTGASEPDTIRHEFSAPVFGTDMAISSDVDIELWEWTPTVMRVLPLPILGRTLRTDGGYRGRKAWSGVAMDICTLGGAVTVTVVIDGTDHDTTFSVTTGANEEETKRIEFAAPLFGTDIALSFSGNVELYNWDATEMKRLPMPFTGRTLETNGGADGVKTITGFQVKVCTLAAARTFTPVVDGTNYPTFSATTGADEPDDVTYEPTTAIEGTAIALSVDGTVELYDWRPIVSALQPLGHKVWDSGPLVFSGGPHDHVWIYEYQMLVKAEGTLTLTPSFDDVAHAAITRTVAAEVNKTGRVDILVGRNYHGRTPRLVVTSASTFYPYWVKVLYRVSGGTGVQAHVISLNRGAS